MSRATSRLSVSPSFPPRPTQAFHAVSRRSRRAENVRNGTISERDSVTTWLALAQAAIARRLACRRPHERRQAVEVGRPLSASWKPASSASTFCAKRVVSWASRSMICA